MDNQSLQKHSEIKPNPIARVRYPWLRDVIGIFLFIIAVIAGAAIINTAVFRSFSVIGPSMEDTMYTGERLIVNRLPITGATLTGTQYIPNRGQIIVFKNPHYKPGDADEYIVKRVIAFPGERVTVSDCFATVFNDQYPNGFNPYEHFDVSNPQECVTGSGDWTVPKGEIFVIGDHRNGNYSLDSRSGLSTIPFNDVVGPVAMRIWPFENFRFF